MAMADEGLEDGVAEEGVLRGAEIEEAEGEGEVGGGERGDEEGKEVEQLPSLQRHMTEQMVCLDGALAFWHIGIIRGGSCADPKRETERFEEDDEGHVLWHAADHTALEEIGDGARQPQSLEEEGD
ncbi:uncharacterized protein A4U43_UnF8170 [Asparagus officinalis]|uniref:Uncharacterized protein n=1 Tax=Asparagus officinalis TaxID=4686 RepID=A0A1R3L604_ASPOF|nr:uncharacterized protein A4U43_UnF8170 [Asparagus officinalis]